MKKIIIIAAIGLSHTVQAQGVLGFFNQQDTKKKRMIEQIALLETYLGEVKKGYSEVENGISTMHDLKNGTFSLHTAYINSLNAVSPSVSSDPSINRITTMAGDIRNCFVEEIRYQQRSGMLSEPEQQYVRHVYQHLTSELNKDLDQLADVITPGRLQLKDEQRITLIDGIAARVADKYAFSRSFTSNIHTLALNRAAEQRSRSILKQLYQIN